MSDIRVDTVNDAAPIDAVITWVDGNDPGHIEKLNSYLESIGHRPRVASSTRFCETGEFEYCVASLLRFAPWIRNIYIVSDAQIPSFIPLIQQSQYAGRIFLVDHRTVFSGYENYLPTFNSRSIESVLWRIPGLSERYIYLNDDFVLLRPVTPSIFFSSGKLVVRGVWETQQKYSWHKRLMHSIKTSLRGGSETPTTRPGNRVGQAKAAAVAGFKRPYLRTPHIPHPQYKSLLEDFFTRHPSILEKNISYRLRSGEQFLVNALTTHLAFLQRKAMTNNKYSTMLLKMNKISLPWLRVRLALADRYSSVAFACIQSLDLAKPKVRKVLLGWLDQRVGKLSDNISKLG